MTPSVPGMLRYQYIWCFLGLPSVMRAPRVEWTNLSESVQNLKRNISFLEEVTAGISTVRSVYSELVSTSSERKLPFDEWRSRISNFTMFSRMKFIHNHTTSDSFVHSFIRLFVHSNKKKLQGRFYQRFGTVLKFKYFGRHGLPSSVRSFVRSFVRSLTYSLIHSLI